MRSGLISQGLIALVCSSTVTIASVLPISEEATITDKATKKTFIVDLYRDPNANALRIERLSNGHNKRSTDPPYPFDHTDFDWYATINLSGQKFSVLVDTGSADTWLLSPNAQPKPIGGRHAWNADSTPNTHRLQGENFKIDYGQGGNGVSAPVYSTNVCMGPACVTMAVGQATSDLGLDAWDGIIGLAFQGGNSVRPNPQPTFMEVLKPQLDQPIFVTRLDGTDGNSSQIAFGYNPFPFVAPMQRAVFDGGSGGRYPYSWSYDGAQYFLNNKYLGTFDVIFDTGGPYTTLPEYMVRQYYSTVPGAKDVSSNQDATAWQVPCNANLPDLVLHLGGAFVIIPGFRFFNGQDRSQQNCYPWLTKENSNTRAVIGDPFFAEHIVVFNQNDHSISWGNRA